MPRRDFAMSAIRSIFAVWAISISEFMAPLIPVALRLRYQIRRSRDSLRLKNRCSFMYVGSLWMLRRTTRNE
jgi:hypothetical protein